MLSLVLQLQYTPTLHLVYQLGHIRSPKWLREFSDSHFTNHVCVFQNYSSSEHKDLQTI